MRKYLIVDTSVFAQMGDKEHTEMETTYEEITKIAELLIKFENKFYIIDLENDTIIFSNK